MKPHRRTWSLYLVRRGDGALYTGIALDVMQRFAAHASGQGAKALRGRGPLVLVFQARIGTRSVAQRVELRVKQLKKLTKERLVSQPTFARRRLAELRAASPHRRAKVLVHDPARLPGIRRVTATREVDVGCLHRVRGPRQ